MTYAFHSNPARLRIEAAGRKFVGRQQAEATAARRKIAEEAARLQQIEIEKAIDEATRASEAAERNRTRSGRIIRETSIKYGVMPTALRGDTRNRKLVRARWECWHRLTAELGLSSNKIGRMFRKDHSTVLYGIRMHQAKREVALA